MSEKARNIPRRRTLKARWVFPVVSAPIPNGAVTLDGPRIAAVGPAPASGEVEDLGNVAILPGLVNAHTHLEFSDLPTPLGGPGMALADWIRRVLDFRRQSAVGGSRGPVELGLEESARLGTTALGEIAQPGWPAVGRISNPPEPVGRISNPPNTGRFGKPPYKKLDLTLFLELIAPTTAGVAPALETARNHLDAARSSKRWHPGLSPHAPYTVHPELLAHAVALSAAKRVPLAMHLAESREELELLRTGGGSLRNLLEELEAWDSTLIATGSRPLDYLRMLSAAHRVLVIHGNYLDDEEIAFLAVHAERMSVVYCPRTHAFFGHPPYPLEKMLSAGVPVALGTDSRASAPDLSVLAEMRQVARQHPTVGRDVILCMGTVNGARDLGRDHELGSLEPGKYADLAVVGLPDRNAADPHEVLFQSRLPVVTTWREGGEIGRAEPQRHEDTK